MRRREFVTFIGGAAAWPLVAKAQPTGKSWRIGQVIGGSAETNGHFARALEQRLGELGYRTPGGNLVLVTECSPQLIAMEDAIRSLIAKIDLLVAWGTIGAVAAKKRRRLPPRRILDRWRTGGSWFGAKSLSSWRKYDRNYLRSCHRDIWETAPTSQRNSPEPPKCCGACGRR